MNTVGWLIKCVPHQIPIAIGTEQRLLKVCASVAENKNWIIRLARHCPPAGRQGQGVNSISIPETKFKALYAAVCGRTFITPTNDHLSNLSDFN